MSRAVLAFLILAVVFPCLACPRTILAGAKYSGGSGEPDDPYQIASAEDLNDIANHVEDFNKCFIQTSDIDLSDYNGLDGKPAFHTIGNPSVQFAGVFDGNSQQITKFTMEGNYFGAPLFKIVDGPAAVIKNVIMVDADVNNFSSGPLACLVGVLGEGTVSNCHVINGRVNSESTAGLLVAANLGRIIDCSVSGDCAAMVRAGGLAGETGEQGTIVNCRSDANVTSLYGIGGGLVAVLSGGLITGCRSSGRVEGQGDSGEIGGLVGRSEGSNIIDCFSSCDVNSGVYSYNVGGLIGYLRYGNVTDCAVAQSVISGGSSVGGLVGHNYGGFAAAQMRR